VFDCTVVEYHDGELHGLAITAELTEAVADDAALQRAISAMLETKGLPPIKKFVIVAPGLNEGVTGKKLKRVIRSEMKRPDDAVAG
jgi:hypothetical protein